MAALSQFVPRIEVSMPNGKELWSLVNGDVSITLRITTSTHDLGWDRAHFEGGAGAERMVRLVQADGHEFLCDGEKVVQVNFPDGRTRSFQYVGEGTERSKVQQVDSDGTIIHFEGDAGAECMVRTVDTDGCVLHYNGMKGMEKVVQVKSPDGRTRSFQYVGEGTERRKVQQVDSDGTIIHFEEMRTMPVLSARCAQFLPTAAWCIITG